jgi:hypothetical protein
MTSSIRNWQSENCKELIVDFEEKLVINKKTVVRELT